MVETPFLVGLAGNRILGFNHRCWFMPSVQPLGNPQHEEWHGAGRSSRARLPDSNPEASFGGGKPAGHMAMVQNRFGTILG